MSARLDEAERLLNAALALVREERDAGAEQQTGKVWNEDFFSGSRRHLTEAGIQALYLMFDEGFTTEYAAKSIGISVRGAAQRRKAWQNESPSNKQQDEGMRDREPWKRVTNPEWFRAVLNAIREMAAKSGVSSDDDRYNEFRVRFGACGEGKQPNFQIVNKNENKIWRYLGTAKGAKRTGSDDKTSWNDLNLSEKRYTSTEVEEMRDSLVA